MKPRSVDPVIAELRRIRISKGLTQRQVATLAGIGLATLGHLETGMHSPMLETVRLLANALGAQITVDGASC